MGTAYSLSDSTANRSKSLAERLANDPSWNPLKAFTLIVFTMLYVPCIATLACIRKETSWKWVWFSICFNIILAYAVSFIIGQGGRILGL
jgi:ferrous iron transport protein B